MRKHGGFGASDATGPRNSPWFAKASKKRRAASKQAKTSRRKNRS